MEALLTFARQCREFVGADWAMKYLRPVYWGLLTAVTSRRGASLRLTDGNEYRLSPRFFAWHVDSYEPGTVKALLGAIVPGSVVYDIGAHVGFISLMAGRKLAANGGRVLALEPSPANFSLLQWHVRINDMADRVTVKRTLVGDGTRDAVPFVVRPGEFTANSLAYEIEGGEAVPTPMTTVDALVQSGEIAPPTHMKIDVEGYEAAVLRGATATLQRHRPWVICAMHPEPLAALGESAAAIVRFMKTFGYSATTLDGRPTDDPGFEEIVFTPDPIVASGSSRS
jgi:FkbM family methyltransferase